LKDGEKYNESPGQSNNLRADYDAVYRYLYQRITLPENFWPMTASVQRVRNVSERTIPPSGLPFWSPGIIQLQSPQ
jgi:hypothetical protein